FVRGRSGGAPEGPARVAIALDQVGRRHATNEVAREDVRLARRRVVLSLRSHGGGGKHESRPDGKSPGSRGGALTTRGAPAYDHASCRAQPSNPPRAGLRSGGTPSAASCSSSRSARTWGTSDRPCRWPT